MDGMGKRSSCWPYPIRVTLWLAYRDVCVAFELVRLDELSPGAWPGSVWRPTTATSTEPLFGKPGYNTETMDAPHETPLHTPLANNVDNDARELATITVS